MSEEEAKQGQGQEEEEEEENEDLDLDTITEDSDLSNPERKIWIVTTAALPWLTGTAVNPLLRALYLTRGRPQYYVTLLIPWLQDESARAKLYGKDKKFSNSSDQEEWIRDFCRTKANCIEEEKNLRIQFYPSVYHQSFGSIFPLVDICNLVPDDEADVAILEEPEHLNWFRTPEVEVIDESSEDNRHQDQEQLDKIQLGWAHKFRYVVGILHTNYNAYMKDYGMGASIIAAPAISMLSSIVVRAYCRQVIRLSAVLPSLAPEKEVTCNVHGVRSEFLDPATVHVEGASLSDATPFFAAVYFIGKVIWAKGFDKVLDLQELYKNENGGYFAMDIYGGGNDERAIKRSFFGRKGKVPGEAKAETDLEEAIKEPSAYDLKALAVFALNASLRSIISVPSCQAAEAQSFEVTRSNSGLSENIAEVGESDGHPLSIIGDISGKSFSIGLEASQAVFKLGDSMVEAGLEMAFTDEDDESDANKKPDNNDETEKVKQNNPFYFDPPQSRFEWRRNPIPARFLGVKDHALLRDILEHKIFLNMSITEVLCTTTAEALAMGKFAIIPRHRKCISMSQRLIRYCD